MAEYFDGAYRLENYGDFSLIEELFSQVQAGDKAAKYQLRRSFNVGLQRDPERLDSPHWLLDQLGFFDKRAIDLIVNKHTQIKTLDILEPGDLGIVVYYNLEVPTKYSLYQGAGNCETKWDNTWLAAHPIGKIPASFGNFIRFYRFDDEADRMVRARLNLGKS